MRLHRIYAIAEHSRSSCVMVTVAINGTPLMTPTFLASWGISSVREKVSSGSEKSSSMIGILKDALVSPGEKEAKNSSPM